MLWFNSILVIKGDSIYLLPLFHGSLNRLERLANARRTYFYTRNWQILYVKQRARTYDPRIAWQKR